MPTKLVWTPQAREDLIEIYRFIGLDNLSAAERVFDAIQKRVDMLSRHPRLGMRRSDIRSSTRVLVEGPYLILYETHPDSEDEHIDAVEVVRIIDGRRYLKNLL